MALGEVFSEDFVFPYKFSFNQMRRSIGKKKGNGKDIPVTGRGGP
jgi:hypothetical protein